VAGAKRQPLAALSDLLLSEGRTFAFFQAVQLIHRLDPKSTPVGELGPASSEPVRFRQEVSLIFPPGDISSIASRPGAQNRFTLTTSFFGLLGVSSPLAARLTEDLLRGDEDETATVKEFYDLFHHRLLSLFYRAWKKYRFEASFRSDGGDRFTPRALAFVGLDMSAALPRFGLPPSEQLALAPLLALRTRPARSLQIVLERLFPGTPVSIEPFVARRVQIENSQRSQLGKLNSRLNQDFVVGRSVEDRSSTFRVVVGPLGHEAFDAFVPGGRWHARLRQVIEQFSGGVLQPEVELHVNADESPRFALGGPRGSRLGIGTQLIGKRTKPMRARILLSNRLEDAATKILADDAV
jgi:type VI secretion system protein ImpH